MVTIKNGIMHDEGRPSTLRITRIELLAGYKIRAEFPDGTIKIYDMSKLLDTEAFKTLKDEKEFKKVTLDRGVPTWEDANVDISPETIYLNGE